MTHQKRWCIDFLEVSFKSTSSACDVRKWEIELMTATRDYTGKQRRRDSSIHTHTQEQD
ncbi:hypothetical protein QJS04_geneDACA015853 [Acorus gramineus]|uniref:Uncharacterized protein n=1 Tax=Acorus gramineus TaxID=55184 RepID=A0AAV9BQ06_ACOGR|nr:hypothetical protein QJS04_geneDACA015853 [Acorus gramineus]